MNYSRLINYYSMHILVILRLTLNSGLPPLRFLISIQNRTVIMIAQKLSQFVFISLTHYHSLIYAILILIRLRRNLAGSDFSINFTFPLFMLRSGTKPSLMI